MSRPVTRVMRYGTLLLGVMFLAVACSTQSNRVASASPSPAVAVSPTASPTPVPIASSYGLLISGATLEMITPDGLLGPSAPIAAATVQSCAPGLNAMLQPPVSRSEEHTSELQSRGHLVCRLLL